MSKFEKVWTCIMIVLFLLNFMMHFMNQGNTHLNYVSSIMSAFAIGMWITNSPRWSDKKEEKKDGESSK